MHWEVPAPEGATSPSENDHGSQRRQTRSQRRGSRSLADTDDVGGTLDAEGSPSGAAGSSWPNRLRMASAPMSGAVLEKVGRRPRRHASPAITASAPFDITLTMRSPGSTPSSRQAKRRARAPGRAAACRVNRLAGTGPHARRSRPAVSALSIGIDPATGSPRSSAAGWGRTVPARRCRLRTPAGSFALAHDVRPAEEHSNNFQNRRYSVDREAVERLLTSVVTDWPDSTSQCSPEGRQRPGVPRRPPAAG